MYTYLKERDYYEQVYDKHTVESARRGMVHYEKFFKDISSKLDKDDTISRPGNAIILNAFYMQTVGLELLDRYQKRKEYIEDWMSKDEAKDYRLATARLVEEPTCTHCGKQQLRIVDKSLMHKGENYKYDDPEHVLFTLKCPHCDKNTAVWEDGDVWEVKKKVCPKCSSDVTHKTAKTKKLVSIKYTCVSCKHSFKEDFDLSIKAESPDPDFDEDRYHYCLLDKDFRGHLVATKKGFEDMAKFSREHKEKEANKDLYDAVKDMKKPKIAELVDLLSGVLSKEGYIEFSLEKPEMGRDVYVGFSCLDSKSGRKDYDSEKTLKKIIQEALTETNWRLMSDGISYRLGYMSGRLRAYEREDDLIGLVTKRKKDGIFTKKSKDKEPQNDNDRVMYAPDGTRIIF